MDFVVAYVDGSDKEWLELKNKYSFDNSKGSEDQYRNWGILKYWFRAIEKYADWVDNIYFVSCGQIPEWLNTECEKLKIIDHKDFIPQEYLPTFSSHTIELNLHKIKGLSEQFVYFNDDMYLSAPIKETLFFKNNLPCYAAILSSLSPYIPSHPFVHYLCNDISVVNAHFNKKNVIRKNISKWFNPVYGKLNFKNLYYGLSGKFSAFTNFHMPSPMLKSVFCEVWEKEYDLLHTTCLNKFRGLNDVNQYVMSYYNICKGNFTPLSPKTGRLLTLGDDTDKIEESFNSGKFEMICVNDNPREIDFEYEKEKLVSIMEKIFPEKSKYEL